MKIHKIFKNIKKFKIFLCQKSYRKYKDDLTVKNDEGREISHEFKSSANKN